eukprot:4187160-Prymnesium_polylepis.1
MERGGFGNVENVALAEVLWVAQSLWDAGPLAARCATDCWAGVACARAPAAGVRAAWTCSSRCGGRP